MCQHDLSKPITIDGPIYAYKVVAVEKGDIYMSPLHPSIRVAQAHRDGDDTTGDLRHYEFHFETHSSLDTTAGIYLYTDFEKAKEQARIWADAKNRDMAVVGGMIPIDSQVIFGITASCRVGIRSSAFVPKQELIRYESRDKVRESSF